MARLTRVAPRPHRHHSDFSAETDRAFRGAVAVGVHQNPMAHGNIETTQTCPCGMVRKVLVNGPHRELGPWLGGVVR